VTCSVPRCLFEEKMASAVQLSSAVSSDVAHGLDEVSKVD
jgi:hypothetical protein